MNIKNKKGFTLVELMAVIIVLIVIIFIAINKVNESTQKAKKNSIKANAISYIKLVRDKAGEDVLENEELESGIFSVDELKNMGIKLSGKSPDSGYVLFSDYKVIAYCLKFNTYIITDVDDINSIKKGNCSSNIGDYTSNFVSYSYDYTSNNYYTFTAPDDGLYVVELWGAQGGSTTNAPGGKGAYTSGILELKKNTTLYIYVGSKGKERKHSDGAGSVAGGYNGGANGNVSRTSCSQQNGAGGGATDIRLVPGAWNNDASLKSRIMVAAGGGGSFEEYCSTSDNSIASGGYAGALVGGDGTYIGSRAGFSSINPKGATQTTGGQSVNEWNSNDYTTTYSGRFGYGSTGSESYGGGGGGYYGGASGKWQPGAGGSSYISGYQGSLAISDETTLSLKPGCSTNSSTFECSTHYSGYVFTNTLMKSGNESMPKTDGSGTMIGNKGNGYARITFLSPTVSSSDSEEYSIPGLYVYSAPRSGTYKLEVWGAQGGAVPTADAAPGYGGYAYGNISLKDGETLYITVGGAGSPASSATGGQGGFNGGGNGSNGYNNNSNYPGAGGGGGATHIAKVSGNLETLSNKVSSVIIVAGGGGGVGAYYTSAGSGFEGGSGGGISGGNGYIKAGTPEAIGGTQTTGYAFGRGGNGRTGTTHGNSSYEGCGGGGAGFYGGFAQSTAGVNTDSSGAGGSGYIGNNKLTNKGMYCYNCSEDSNEDTKTTSTTCAQSTATANCAKVGNGYAKITFVSAN